MADLSKSLYLRPIEVHYSQDSISCNFTDGQKIGETLDQLVRMSSFVMEIPLISVVRKDDKYYTKNNRRLWVFRQMAMMDRCEFIPVKLSDYLPDGQFTTMTDGYDVAVRGNDGSRTLQKFRSSTRDKALDDLESLQQTLTHGDPLHFTPRFEQPLGGGVGKKKRLKLKAKRRIMNNNQADTSDFQIPPYEPGSFFGDNNDQQLASVVFKPPPNKQTNYDSAPRPQQRKRPMLSGTFTPLTEDHGMPGNAAPPDHLWQHDVNPMMTPFGDGYFQSYMPTERGDGWFDPYNADEQRFVNNYSFDDPDPTPRKKRRK